MIVDEADAGGDDSPLLRPFLERGRSRPPAREARADDLLNVGGVRPYYLTQGRTRVVDESIGFETVLLASERGRRRRRSLQFEQRRIVDECQEPISVAELAVALGVPIGVARILASDLSSAGLIQRHQTVTDPSRNIDLLTRLIDGVRAL
ncbi:MAG: DUF742 domain-containing protein [Acidimicrobiia bacterium]|nr:DUF742 domain-containing protein [Acidimicrobiia bacterium]